MLEKMIFNPDLKIVCFFPTSLCGVLVFGCVLPVRLPPPPPPATCPQLDHTQLTHNLLTHNLSTHNLPTHTQHTHTQLTHTHTKDPHTTYSHTTCSHTKDPHTTYTHTQLAHSHLALGDRHLHFAWQTWRLVTSTFTLRGRCGTWWHRPSLCVAGVALGDIDLHFAWQAWHLVTSTFTLRGRRGTWWHRPSLCVASVALGDMDLHFVWQAWHLWHWAGCGGAWVWWAPRHFAWQAWRLVTSTFTLRGRRGTWWHRPSLCVAGVALGDMDLHFVWEARHLWHWAGCGGAWVWRAPRHFAWQAWRLVTSTFTLRGRRGTWWHRPSLCVAGVALGDMDLHFVWQAWHLWHWAGCGGAWVWRVPRHFAWQAWRLVMAPRSWLHNILHPQHFHTRLFHTHTHAHHFYTPHLYTHFFHQHTFTRNSFTHLTLTCISYTHRSSTIFFPLPTFPIPSSPFFGYLLEEVGMWGYPVLLFSWWILCFDPPWICTPSSWHTTIKF